MDFLAPLKVLGTPTAAAVTGSLFLAAFLFYRWLLPKPIAGIPYNQEATQSIFGDIPGMLKHVSTHKTITDWLFGHNVRHNSPIVQVFARFFTGPMIVISDYHESHDILLRRTKEFDKPDMISDIFAGVAPDFHTVEVTNDEWRYHRKLMQDLMIPRFLHGVAAPQLHASFSDLIKLWSEKKRLSQGRPFPVKNDIYDTALEAIWAAVFGIDDTATVTRQQIQLLSSTKNIDLPSTTDEEVVFSRAPAPESFDAILKITDAIEFISKSPFPRFAGWFCRHFVPSIRRCYKVKADELSRQISKAERRLEASLASEDKEGTITNAVDHMLRREKMAAEKLGRAPRYQSKVMRDELFGLLIAGHDTTSTTLAWGLKFLTANPHIQTRLRTTLQTTYPEAHSSDRAPSAHEIATTPCAYLDACIEEILRCATTGVIASRTTTQDVVVLGHVIPKNTRIAMCTNGGGIQTAAYPIPDSLRSASHIAAGGGKTRAWDPATMRVFNPDRWLVTDTDSNSNADNKAFDSLAGPHLSFGGGLRGCFGKKLAYLELRIALVLILWAFELHDVPERYAGWEAVEVLTHAPVQCYVNLVEVGKK